MERKQKFNIELSQELLNSCQAIDAGTEMILTNIEDESDMDKIKGSMLKIRQANMFVQMKIANILDYDFINLKNFTPRWE